VCFGLFLSCGGLESLLLNGWKASGVVCSTRTLRYCRFSDDFDGFALLRRAQRAMFLLARYHV
jgi:hypothetical protein